MSAVCEVKNNQIINGNILVKENCTTIINSSINYIIDSNYNFIQFDQNGITPYNIGVENIDVNITNSNNNGVTLYSSTMNYTTVAIVKLILNDTIIVNSSYDGIITINDLYYKVDQSKNFHTIVGVVHLLPNDSIYVSRYGNVRIGPITGTIKVIKRIY